MAIIKLGSLNFLLSRHKVEVNPFVAYLETKQVFQGNYEIDTIFTVPISFLTNNFYKNNHNSIIFSSLVLCYLAGNNENFGCLIRHHLYLPFQSKLIFQQLVS